jgi:hypothetical protein
MPAQTTDWRVQEARNAAASREINEWTLEAGRSELRSDRSMHAYFCECSDARCRQRIDLTDPEYEVVRSEAVRFLIAPLHENPEIDRVVAENERYATVEMFYGEPARVARATDPRR